MAILAPPATFQRGGSGQNWFTSNSTATVSGGIGRPSSPTFSNTATVSANRSNGQIRFTKFSSVTRVLTFFNDDNIPCADTASTDYNGFRLERAGSDVGVYTYTATITWELVKSGSPRTIYTASLTQAVAATSTYDFDFSGASERTHTLPDDSWIGVPLTVRGTYTLNDDTNGSAFTLNGATFTFSDTLILLRPAGALFFGSNF